jgi:hypothetical protein
VLLSCAGSLVVLRAQLRSVAYLNDSAVHEEMVRAALAAIRVGHFPPGGWFPFLNLGSPQFLHYQSLSAMLTALLAWVIGVGHAFTLTTWLLECCWPICVYAAARIFGVGRGAAAAAGVLSPFISSATGIGYEQASYLWSGYGLWSQLFAMWTLPFAWACSWRAVDERRYLVPAALLVAATAALHFETGYLAFLGVAVFTFARRRDFVRRAGRAALVVAGAIGMAAWALVPLVAEGKWAAINQFLQSGPEGADANSYGARRVLSWLVDGDLFDWHHFVLVTPLVGVGLVVAVAAGRARSGSSVIEAGLARALLLVFVACLVLFFGRPTLGVALDLLPGAKDLFLRRFLVGVQFAGVLLAGVGAWQLACWIHQLARRATKTLVSARGRTTISCVALGVLAAIALGPAWSFLVTTADENGTLIAEQGAASTAVAQVDALVSIITARGDGRTFAGDPNDWGPSFTVGEVPVFKYLASLDVDEVGFTLRTASLMSGPENEFDDSDPADYALFGIRWLLLPVKMPPAVPARLVMVRGNYSLWEIPTNSYVQVIDTSGQIAANSGDLGSFAGELLSALSSSHPVYPTVAYEGGAAATGTLPVGLRPTTSPGRVIDEHADLAAGTVTTTVELERTAVVMLSASYDPGWQVLVDGTPARTEMVAPAVIGVKVAPGAHTVRFLYRGFPDYPQLLGLGLAALGALIGFERRTRRRKLASAARLE